MVGDCWLNNSTATIPNVIRTTSICQRNCFIEESIYPLNVYLICNSLLQFVCWARKTLIQKERNISVPQRQKKKGTFTPQTKPCGRNCLSGVILKSAQDKNRDHQSKEQHTQHDGGPEQSAFHATTGGENTSRVSACQSTQACALTLQDHA
jgi:hypothetical protein